MCRRAVDYRAQFEITPEMTECTIVAMVFANMGEDSDTVHCCLFSMLQTRHGKMNNAGAVRLSVGMDNKGLSIMEQDGLRFMNHMIDQLIRPQVQWQSTCQLAQRITQGCYRRLRL